MAARSTRNRIRYQAEKAINHLDIAVENLAKLEAMAAEQSPYINEQLPKIILMMEGAKTVLSQFRDGL